MKIQVSKKLPHRKHILATIHASLKYSPVLTYDKLIVKSSPKWHRQSYYGMLRESNRNRKNLIMVLNPHNSEIRMVSTTFHEMRHAWQFCSGKVKSYKRGYLWNNWVFIPYAIVKAIYSVLPWERDAVNYENWMTLEAYGKIAEDEA